MATDAGLSRRNLLKYGLMGLAGGQMGCWPGRAEALSQSASSFEAPKNCLFIVLDAATAGHFGSWGYSRKTTPNIDDFATGGFSFRNAFSQASATVPSVRSYLTGRYPSDVRIHLLEEEVTLADAFRRNGHATAIFSENPYITPAFNYQKGFDADFSYFSYRALQKSKRNLEDVRIESEKLHGDLRSWISSAGASPWFCYVHHLRPHAPYFCPEPFASRFATGDPVGRANGSAHTLRMMEAAATLEEAAYLAALYDGNLSYSDHLVGGLLDWLDASKRLDDTLVIIASDHGEAFMQHGSLQHGTTTYDEMIHVPLIFRLPGSSGMAVGRSAAQIELVDLFPTVASLFGFDETPPLDGRSLVPLLGGDTQPIRDHVYSLSPRSGRNSFAVRTPERKYIVKLDRAGRNVETRELYDLGADPLETTNLLAKDQRDAELEALLVARFPNLLGAAASHSTAPLDYDGVDEHTREALEALGYIR